MEQWNSRRIVSGGALTYAISSRLTSRDSSLADGNRVRSRHVWDDEQFWPIWKIGLRGHGRRQIKIYRSGKVARILTLKLNWSVRVIESDGDGTLIGRSLNVGRRQVNPFASQLSKPVPARRWFHPQLSRAARVEWRKRDMKSHGLATAATRQPGCDKALEFFDNSE